MVEDIACSPKTATELGIEIGIFNSPGWSQSGGPWVKPEQAMRYLASVKAEVSGGKQVEVVLAKPDKDFQDVRVIAFPSVEKKATRLSAANAKVTSAMSLQNLNSLIDGDKETAVLFTEKSEKPVAIDSGRTNRLLYAVCKSSLPVSRFKPMPVY